MIKIFYVALGGAFGAIFRYWISGLMQRILPGSFPWPTIGVNLLGSLLIGFLLGIFDASPVSPNVKLFVFIGLLGSFTTFSTFAVENFHLMRQGDHWMVFSNVMVSVILGVGLVFFGYFASRLLMKI